LCAELGGKTALSGNEVCGASNTEELAPAEFSGQNCWFKGAQALSLRLLVGRRMSAAGHFVARITRKAYFPIVFVTL